MWGLLTDLLDQRLAVAAQVRDHPLLRLRLCPCQEMASGREGRQGQKEGT